MKVTVSISVEENLRNQVADLAAREERSFSSMFSVLAQRALDFSPEKTVPLRMLEPEMEAKPPKNGPKPSEKAVFAAKKPKVRKEECMHRVPAGAYCKWGCDSA